MGKNLSVSALTKRAKIIFWDFDGVIKESVDIKTKIFITLFQQYGKKMIEKVKLHHEANGGVSRFAKFRIYLEWANKEVTTERIQALNEEFSLLSFKGVVNAPWVPGAEEYLRNNPNNQLFVVVSATPKEELVSILQKLRLNDIFIDIYGSPITKKDAIAEVLQKRHLTPENAIVIGDSIVDQEAATVNHVPFILRRHKSNLSLFDNYKGYEVADILEL
jgi:phosphoglycolate phosphatase-like HAD superfamily hydrolase